MSRYSLRGPDVSATYTRTPLANDFQASGGGYKPVIAAQQTALKRAPIAQPQPGPAAFPGTLTTSESRAMPSGAMRLGPRPAAMSPFAIANQNAGAAPGSRLSSAVGIFNAGRSIDTAHDAALNPSVNSDLTATETSTGGDMPRPDVDYYASSSSSSGSSAQASANYGAWAAAVGASVLLIGGLAWWVWGR